MSCFVVVAVVIIAVIVIVVVVVSAGETDLEQFFLAAEGGVGQPVPPLPVLLPDELSPLLR